MFRTAFTPATVLTGFVLLSSSVLHADSFAPLGARTHASSVPSVTTYATGLTNPRGLSFGPDGNLYVAEAGIGGGQTPADIDMDVHATRNRSSGTFFRHPTPAAALQSAAP